jgi:hypothetical protein
VTAADVLAAATAKARADHAAQHPAGCPRLCSDCWDRLGCRVATCPVCQRSVPSFADRVGPHPAPQRGRAGYSAAHYARVQGNPDCTGSGRTTRHQ